MLTTKNAGGNEGVKAGNITFAPRAGHSPTLLLDLLFIMSLAVAVLTGCRPPGPRALLDGQRLVERGQYEQAVARLKTATSLLSTNANAWNYLGLAYHQAGQPADAADAYKKAISLDQNLIEAHYNLGCLWLEQNRPDLAKPELTAYTLRREKSPEGWIKLGEAQLALRDLAGAEKSLNQARQFDAQNAEALNDLGVVQVQRNRATEAAQYFGGALRTKPDYAPAILNLAIVSQFHLNNRQYALQRYQDYLALKPRPADWEAVEAAARSLEQELNPSAAASSGASVPAATPTSSSPTTAPRPANNPPPRTAVRIEQPAPVASRTAAPSHTSGVEVVKVAPEPVIRSAQDVGSANSSQTVISPHAGPPPAEHRGFFSRVNPANLFRSNPKSNEPSASVTQATPEPPPITYPRYHYRSPAKPAEGDRRAAEKAFTEGSQLQQAGDLLQAAAAYRRATESDPGYFAPYYNLGIVSLQSGNLPQALSAYETALAIEPDSHDARFNFALVLKRANYPVDAAEELEKVLARSPDDTNAHYALANVYVELRQPAKAREHYQKVLELNPAFPQAAAVHDWLWKNPR
jgi:tetratricopeptide (TPR) repeat protein